MKRHTLIAITLAAAGLFALTTSAHAIEPETAATVKKKQIKTAPLIRFNNPLDPVLRILQGGDSKAKVAAKQRLQRKQAMSRFIRSRIEGLEKLQTYQDLRR